MFISRRADQAQPRAMRGGETTMMMPHTRDSIRMEVAFLGAPFGAC
jgi:hypothetical protein